MDSEEIKLNDIADNLLIFNKTTVDTLFKLDNCSDCISLYVFYYKTAKWQKTNKIKATDAYVCKCLKWGKSKLTANKKILKDNGLIELIQNRKNGKIDSWYIQINYIVSSKKISGLKFSIENSSVADFTVAENTTSCSQDTNALKEYIKCLKEKIEMLKKKNIKENIKESSFDKFWEAYPKKVSKGNAEKWFIKNKPSEELINEMIKKINLFKKSKQWQKNNGQFIPYPATWLNSKGWEDEINIDDVIETDEEETARLEAIVEEMKKRGEWIENK